MDQHRSRLFSESEASALHRLAIASFHCSQRSEGICDSACAPVSIRTLTAEFDVEEGQLENLG
jgi:hypothetical protein